MIRSFHVEFLRKLSDQGLITVLLDLFVRPVVNRESYYAETREIGIVKGLKLGPAVSQKQSKTDGLTPEQRRERDAKALQEKLARKAAKESAGAHGGKNGVKTNK
ncbi:hypothetical protein SSX86_026731 [Deinandra increscens subsp. villosa]|uniref:Small EDRK-rich factor-like N-terminal domain-containing protein n=1 Tax=Deinandra increscens subsp. villosa TaxID=3103831 RepID=A0AAP0CFE0_9ASTR